MKRTLALFTVLLTVLSSCHFLEGHRIKGDGNITSSTHTVTGFDGIDVGGAMDIYLTQGSDYSVRIVADENLHEYIEVRKEGSKLHIQPANNTNLDATGKIKVYVTAPVFNKIEVSGACNIQSETKLSSDDDIDINLSGASNADLEVNSPSIKVEASGASDVSLRGETKDLAIDGSGSTNVKAFELLSENADVEISGAGDVEVYASVKLKAHSSGASNIRYKGNPAVESHKSGAGSIRKVN